MVVQKTACSCGAQVNLAFGAQKPCSSGARRLSVVQIGVECYFFKQFIWDKLFEKLYWLGGNLQISIQWFELLDINL